MALRKPEVVEVLDWLNTFSATSDAPGATPSILMLHAESGTWALNPATL